MNRRHAHRAPSNLRRTPLPANYEWSRRDVDYDPIRPVEVIALVPIAIFVVIAFIVGVGLLFAVLAPEVGA